jgi:hypothetical protein
MPASAVAGARAAHLTSLDIVGQPPMSLRNVLPRALTLFVTVHRSLAQLWAWGACAVRMIRPWLWWGRAIRSLARLFMLEAASVTWFRDPAGSALGVQLREKKNVLLFFVIYRDEEKRRSVLHYDRLLLFRFSRRPRLPSPCPCAPALLNAAAATSRPKQRGGGGALSVAPRVRPESDERR